MDYVATLEPYRLTYKDYINTYSVILLVDKRPIAFLNLPYQAGVEGNKDKAIALLMSNQLHFDVLDGLCSMLVANIAHTTFGAIVGVPTLGLMLAEGVARNLRHKTYVPLSLSEKFWYDNEASSKVSSITSGKEKALYLDPAMRDRLAGKSKVLIVDDVICTGKSAATAYQLVSSEVPPENIYIAVVMTESKMWQETLQQVGFDWRNRLFALGHTYIFQKNNEGLWEVCK